MSPANTLQSIIISKSKFTREQADEWIKKHKFKLKFGNKDGPDITLHTFRYRQAMPKKNARYYVKRISNGIEFVLFS